MRLIDADALLEELKKTYHYFDLKFLIEDAPTIKPSGGSGVFIPDISVEQLRNASLEGVEELLAEGVMRDVLADRPTAEPCKSAKQNVADVPIGDLIRREDALEQMAQAECGLHYEDCEADNCCCSYIQRILDLPTADRPSADVVHKPDYSYEADMVKRLKEATSGDRPNVAYICDGRKCDEDCSECFRTLDIEHARDFKLLGDTYYQQSSADKFISVVRCKDCKNRVYDDSRDYYYCSMFYGQGDVSDDNFCQWGERKGGQYD